MNNKRARWRALAIIIAITVIFIIIGLDSRLKICHYEVDTEQIDNNIRIALITDLHSCKYGKNQQELIDAVDGQKPDVIMLGGDIFDDELDDANTELFLRGVCDKYPCYYVTGNHEYWCTQEKFDKDMAILAECGIENISDRRLVVDINGETLNICGIDDPDSYRLSHSIDGETTFSEELAMASEMAQNGNFTVLLSHRPEYFNEYAASNCDLALCGHAHGGQWRIPGLLNGIFAPNQGLFPKYAGGEYIENGTTVIVSRGLARESTLVPRIYNRPELVIIDIK